MLHLRPIALCLTSLLALTAAAQLRDLGGGHFMQALPTDKPLAILPVQESAPMAHIKVIKANALKENINIRLAVDSVDYCVPFTIDGADVLDITDYQGGQAITFATEYDASNRETFRPHYHASPAYGWMNDPNGMWKKDGVWHLCYQWNPYSSYWENLSWGHSTSTDLIHWTAQPAPLYPDALGMIFSGSTVVDEENTAGFGRGAVIAYYTSAGKSQKQCMAYSTDGGRTFTKYKRNPVLTFNEPDFRDPKIIRYDGRWIMALAVGQQMKFYSSENLKDWTFESSFGHDYGCHGGVWECPDLIDMGAGRWMLICNINPGGPAGGSATQYFIGQFDGHKFTTTDSPETVKWMDYGKDHYAAVTFDGDTRHIIAWMSNWQYADRVPTKQYRAANTLVRELGLYDYDGQTYCSVLPAKEYDKARGARLRQPTDACEIVAQLKGDATLTLSNDGGEQVVMTYNAKAQTFTMDRTRSGLTGFAQEFPATATAPTHGAMSGLRIFIDRTSIEAFATNGHMAMTNIVFPKKPYNKLTVKGKAKTTIYKFNY